MNDQPDSSANLAPRRIAKIFIVVGSVLLLALFVAISLPCLLTSQSAEREGAAFRIVMQINKAQETYFLGKGHGKYASLQTLGAEGLRDEEFYSGTSTGYIFTTNPVEGGDKPMFDVTARPSSVGTWGVGNRSFYSNETQIVYDADGGEPPQATAQNRVPENGQALQGNFLKR
jgi:hypothetical protein